MSIDERKMIEHGGGQLTRQNVGEFVLGLREMVHDQHDSRQPAGEYNEFKIWLFSHEVIGHYYSVSASQGESEPGEVVIDYVDNELIE